MRTDGDTLRPTRDRGTALTTTLDTGRHRDKRAVAERKDAREQEHRAVTFAAQCATLPAQQRENPYLPAVHARVLPNVLRRLDRACESSFRRVKSGDGEVGSPRFRGRAWYDAFCYPQWGNGAQLVDGRLVLSKVGRVRVCADRPLAGTPNTCTIVRKAAGWDAHSAREATDEARPATCETVGVGAGLTHVATRSTGETLADPRHYRAAARRVRRAQRRVSRRAQGSKRRAQARTLLAKAHLPGQRQRRDFAHNAALTLVRRFDCIVVEDLNIRGMLRKHALAKHIQDAGWGQFRQLLSDKAVSAGRVVVAVNPAGTSQACSACGARVPQALSVRWHACPYCGCELDRDHNVASNLKTRGDTAFGEPTAPAAALNREPHTR